jgi:hypothetical protein
MRNLLLVDTGLVVELEHLKTDEVNRQEVCEWEG